MKVAVIQGDGKVLAHGEWDGKRVDGEYAKVNGQLYHCAYVFHAEHAEEITKTLLEKNEVVKKAEDDLSRTLYEFGNKYRAR